MDVHEKTNIQKQNMLEVIFFFFVIDSKWFINKTDSEGNVSRCVEVMCVFISHC